LPDPSPIALSSVDRPSPLTLPPGRSGLQASLANGNVVKAPAPQPIAGSHDRSQSLALSIEDWVLTAQAAINEAILSSESNFQNASLAPAQISPYPAMPAAASPPAQAQLQAEIRARYEWGATPSASDLAEDQDLAPPPSASKASRLAPQAVISLVSGHPASNSALVIEAPFQLPQMQRPILMTIQQEDENEAHPARRAPAAKRWSVNFSLDAGASGQIQVRIGLSAAAVSVRLSSDRTESAALLSAWLPELKAALEQADFTVDELSVRKTASFDGANRPPILL
jgi:hypothetical protein